MNSVSRSFVMVGTNGHILRKKVVSVFFVHYLGIKKEMSQQLMTHLFFCYLVRVSGKQSETLGLGYKICASYRTPRPYLNISFIPCQVLTYAIVKINGRRSGLPLFYLRTRNTYTICTNSSYALTPQGLRWGGKASSKAERKGEKGKGLNGLLPPTVSAESPPEKALAELRKRRLGGQPRAR